MTRIIDKRGTGKTNRLMLLAKENNAVFVCSNPDAMKVKAQTYGINNIQFISYNNFIHNFDPEITNYVIDELEIFIQYIFTSGLSLIGYSLSIE